MAEEPTDNPEGATITTTEENIGTNNGEIVNNNHTVENNVAVWDEALCDYKPSTGIIVNNNAGATVEHNNAEAVKTSYNPKYIGLGSVIFINEKGYKVVEIKDDAYVVVSFDALPDEDVADLDALFAKLFTAEQQKLIKNVGQLLDAEDVLTIFGKPGNHPVFEVNKALVQ